MSLPRRPWVCTARTGSTWTLTGPACVWDRWRAGSMGRFNNRSVVLLDRLMVAVFIAG